MKIIAILKTVYFIEKKSTCRFYMKVSLDIKLLFFHEKKVLEKFLDMS